MKIKNNKAKKSAMLCLLALSSLVLMTGCTEDKEAKDAGNKTEQPVKGSKSVEENVSEYIIPTEISGGGTDADLDNISYDNLASSTSIVVDALRGQGGLNSCGDYYTNYTTYDEEGTNNLEKYLECGVVVGNEEINLSDYAGIYAETQLKDTDVFKLFKEITNEAPYNGLLTDVKLTTDEGITRITYGYNLNLEHELDDGTIEEYAPAEAMALYYQQVASTVDMIKSIDNPRTKAEKLYSDVTYAYENLTKNAYDLKEGSTDLNKYKDRGNAFYHSRRMTNYPVKSATDHMHYMVNKWSQEMGLELHEYKEKDIKGYWFTDSDGKEYAFDPISAVENQYTTGYARGANHLGYYIMPKAEYDKRMGLASDWEYVDPHNARAQKYTNESLQELLDTDIKALKNNYNLAEEPGDIIKRQWAFTYPIKVNAKEIKALQAEYRKETGAKNSLLLVDKYGNYATLWRIYDKVDKQEEKYSPFDPSFQTLHPEYFYTNY